MINSNKEAGAGFIAAVRSLSKQFPCPEKTNGDIKPGLLLVSLDQLSSNAVGPEKLLDDLQSMMILSADHMPSDKQQQQKKKKRKGKNDFLNDKPPRVMPMASFSFTYEVDTDEPKLLGLQLLRSPTATTENEDGGVGTLREALISDRRITSKNIVKWAQQLSESLWKIHTSYITVGDFDLDDIFLVSDIHFQRMLEQNSPGSSPAKGEEAAGHATEDSRRNAWIDTFLLFRRKIATYTALQRPQSAIQILDDSSSTASVNLPSSLSVSSSVRQPSSLSSSSVNIALSSRRTVRAHNASLLRRLDKNKKAEVSLRRSESTFEEVRVAYSQWCRHAQRDCRRLGILLLQLIAHRVFASREVRELNDLVVELASDEVVTKAAAAAGRVSQDDDNSEESSEAENASGDVILFQVARELQRRYPLVGGMPVELQQLLAVCFAPKEEMVIKGTHANNKNSMAKFTFDFMRKLGEAIADLTELAEENAEIANYVKPVYWTDADERERLEKKKKAQLEMQKKAEIAAVTAIERVRVERYKLWFSNQPEDYQREFHRKKAAKARSKTNMKERKNFIQKALFHTWSWDDFAPWLHKTILGYLLRVLSWKVVEDERARFRRRNPNPNSVAQLKEKSQKNLKLESVLQSIAKEDASETVKKGTDLYIQMQIDDLVGAISPFVIQKLRDFAIAEAEAAQEVALVASSLKSRISSRHSRQSSISHDLSRSSSYSSAALPSLSMERPPSRGLTNPNLPSERPLSRGLSSANLPSERHLSRGLSSANLSSERPLSRGLSSSNLPSERPLSRGLSSANLPSERPLSRGLSSANLPSERPLSRGLSSSNLPSLSTDRPPSRGLSNSISFINTHRSKFATARSGQTSRPTTQSKTILEVNEEALRWFVDRLVPILQSYFKQPVQITKCLRQCVSEEIPSTDELVADAKLLVTSPAQLLHRRIVCRADLLTTKHCKMIRKACAEFCESIKILDRSYAQKFSTIISVAMFYRYHEEQDVRLKGENFAASKLTSFFQSVRIRSIVKHIWHQANEQYLHDTRHHNRSRSRAASEHEHEHDRKDNLTSAAAAIKSAAVVEKKDKSGWIAQARPPIDVEWTVMDSDGVVSLTFEFNSCGRENLATWKKVRCFGYESRHPNLTQSSGPTSQIVLSLKTFLNMQSDDFESKPMEFLPLALQSFSVRSPSSGHVVFTATIACQRLSRQVRFALTVALDPELTAMLRAKHAVYFKQKCDASITGTGRAGQGHPPSTAAAAVHKCSVRWAAVKPVRIAGHAKPLGENLLFAVDQFFSLPGVLPLRLPAPHMQLSLSAALPPKEEEAAAPGPGHPLPGPALLLFDLPTREDRLDTELTEEGDHHTVARASSTTRGEQVAARVPACLWLSTRLSWEPSEQDLPQHTGYEAQRRLVMHIARRARSGQQQQQQGLWKGEWQSIGRQENPNLHENLLVCVEHPPPSSPPRRRRSVDLTEFRHRILSFIRKHAVEILQHPVWPNSHSHSCHPNLDEGDDDEMLDSGLVVFVQYQVRATNSAGRGPYSPPAVIPPSSPSNSFSNSNSNSIAARTEQEIDGGRLAQIVVARSQLLASIASATAKDHARSELIRSIIATAASLSDRQDSQLQLDSKQEAADREVMEDDVPVDKAVVVSPEEEWLARLPDFCPF